MSMFFTSRKTDFKSWLDTSSIPHRHLAVCRASSAISYRFPNSSCLLDSFSTPGGLIELLFLNLMSCSSIPQLLTTFSLTPPSITSSIPLDTCIYRALLRVYIFTSLRSDSHFFDLSICLLLFISQTPSLSLQTSSFVIFQAFSSFFFSW